MTEYTINHEHKMILFWGGMYSNWYPAKFRIDGKTYSTVEKYMMAQKAITMGDMVSHAKIMKCNDARLIKKYGREIKPYDDHKWASVRLDIVTKGVYEKFKQNPELLTEMLQFPDYEIVEASPYDKIWGIGLSEDDPKALFKRNWQGQNLLGKACMKAREMLAFESQQPTTNLFIYD